MTPAAIPEVKAALRSVELAALRTAARAALEADDAARTGGILFGRGDRGNQW